MQEYNLNQVNAEERHTDVGTDRAVRVHGRRAICHCQVCLSGDVGGFKEWQEIARRQIKPRYRNICSSR